VRAFVAPDLDSAGPLRVRFARALLYRDELLHRSEPAAVMQ
jgi:hypothetical protein